MTTPVHTLQPFLDEDGRTAFEVGQHHGLTDHEFYPDNLPRECRQDYARGYTRGAAQRANAPEGAA